MVVDRAYKISAFGDFASIKATPENMQYFFETFKGEDLLPAVFQEFQLNMPTKPVNVVPSPVAQQRIMLVSADNTIQITFGTQRIDYEVIAKDDVRINPEHRTEINRKVAMLFEVVFTKFGKTASRLALNTESLIVNLTSEEYSSFMKRYSNPISLYNNVSLDEWSTRLMVRKDSKIGTSMETFNVITTIEKRMLQKVADGDSSSYNGFAVNADINTVAENNISRFNAVHITEFIDIAVNWWDNIIEELDGINEKSKE